VLRGGKLSVGDDVMITVTQTVSLQMH